MSNTFTKPSDLIAGTTARAEDINNRVDSTETGFDNVEAITNRTIKLPVGTSGDQLVSESAPNRALKEIGFDASGNLVLISSAFQWKGDWATSTAYIKNDMVRDSSTKNIYTVQSDHTSGVLATDISSAKLSLAINVADVETAKTAAQTAQTAAELAETNAETAETNAETAETNVAADLVLTNADVVLTHADVVLAEADKVQTGLDRAAVAADLVLTNADVVLTHADVVLAEADKVQTGLDKVATNADVVLTHADVVLAEADKVQTNLDRVATNADVVLTHADVVLAEADKVQTGLDRSATAADLVLTNADVVLTHADVVLTHADVVSTNADVLNTADKLPKSGGRLTGDVSHDDNVKAKFGTGDDLQIYHSGTHSYIKDTGTGNLNIQASASINILNADSSDYMARFNDNGAVQLFHDGSQKLATTSTGVDVTGTVTADQLNSKDGKLFLDDNGSHNGVINAPASLYVNFDSDNNNASEKIVFGYDRDGTSGGANVMEINPTGVDVTGEITADGLALGDNQKATFGTGDDLQIYHDGVNGRIRNSTGTLKIQSTSNGENGIELTPDGKTALFHDGVEKLATTATGVDITGTVTADGLVVDGVSTLNNHTKIADGYSLGWGDITTRITGNSSTDLIQQYTAGVQRQRTASNGDISFYEDTGTTAKFFWDASAERLGIGTSSPDSKIHLNDGALHIQQTDGSDTWFGLGTNNDNYITTGASGVTVFRAVGTERLRISATGDVGIGTSSPDGTLHVHTASAGTVAASSQADDLVIENNTEGGMTIITPDAQSARIRFTSPSTNNNVGGASIFYRQNINKMSIGTEVAGGTIALKSGAGVEALTLDSFGNVGIGTGSPRTDYALDVQGVNDNGVNIQAGNAASDIALSVGSTSTADKFVVLAGGNVGIGTDSPDALVHAYSTNNALLKIEEANGYATLQQSGVNTYLNSISSGGSLILRNGLSATERLRISATGDVLVGTTSSSSNTAGIKLSATGTAAFVRSGVQPLLVNRLTSDGDIAVFQKDGTTIGSVGAKTGGMYLGEGASGLYFLDAFSAVIPWNAGGNTTSDAALDLGLSTRRFKDLYLSGGVYLGGTGAANKLDDYEEGTWTPTVTHGTISSTSSTYTKIGNTVRLSTAIFSFSDRTTVLNIAIAGMPFVPEGENVGSVMSRYANVGTGGFTSYIAGTEIKIFHITHGGNWGQVNHSELNSSSAKFYIDIIYQTNS